MVIYSTEPQKVVAIDYNTVAPMAASDQMFPIQKADGPAGYRVPGRINVHGPLSVGVSGVVAGLCLALQEFGRLTLLRFCDLRFNRPGTDLCPIRQT